MREADSEFQLSLLDEERYPCSVCPWANRCNAKREVVACPPDWPTPGAGEHEFSPLHIEGQARYESVGGFGFPILTGRRKVPNIPAGIVPVTVRGRPAAAHEGWAAVKASDIEASGHVISERELVAEIGLPPATRVLVEWFDEDDDLERLDAKLEDLLPQLPFAGYAAHTMPSFSTYTNRAYFHGRYGMVRSISRFSQFIDAGIPSIPHVAPLTIGDVRDYAEWLAQHPWIRTVAFDLACGMKARSLRGLRNAALLDAMTNGTLHFVVHGPASSRNIQRTTNALVPERLTITNAHATHVTTRATGSPAEVLAELASQAADFEASAMELEDDTENDAA